MKTSVTNNVAFNASTKTLSFAISNFDVRKLYAVINQTRGVLIYSTASTTLGFTSLSDNVMVLQLDTTSMSNTDVLQVLYEVDETNELLFAIQESLARLAWLGSARLPTGAVNVAFQTAQGISGTVTANTQVNSASQQAQWNLAAILSNINNIEISV
jgi:hypothetical protein